LKLIVNGGLDTTWRLCRHVRQWPTITSYRK